MYIYNSTSTQMTLCLTWHLKDDVAHPLNELYVGENVGYHKLSVFMNTVLTFRWRL